MTQDQPQQPDSSKPSLPPTPPIDAAPIDAEPAPTLDAPVAEEPTIVAPPAGPNLWQRIWPVLEPFVHRAKLNMTIWAPVLGNPRVRSKVARFTANRDIREGSTWRIELPKQCWKTGATENLERKLFAQDVRSYELPLPILGTALGISLLFFILALWLLSWKLLLTSLLCVLGGAVAMFVKSWQEEVELTVWTSPESAEELLAPDMVVYENELHVFLPTDKLAEATRAMILADRLRKRNAAPEPERTTLAPPSRDTSSISLDDSPAPAAKPGTPSDRVETRLAEYRREELPPIKLDD